MTKLFSYSTCTGEWRQRSKCELPNAVDPFFGAKLSLKTQNVQIFFFDMLLLNYKSLFFMNAFSSEKHCHSAVSKGHLKSGTQICRRFKAHDLITCESKDVATWIWPPCWVLLAQIWPFSNLSQQHPTCRNTSQHGGQTHTTCCAQQYCDMLRWHVAIVFFSSPGCGSRLRRSQSQLLYGKKIPLAPKVVLHERRVGINKQSSEISQRCCWANKTWCCPGGLATLRVGCSRGLHHYN